MCVKSASCQGFVVLHSREEAFYRNVLLLYGAPFQKATHVNPLHSLSDTLSQYYVLLSAGVGDRIRSNRSSCFALSLSLGRASSLLTPFSSFLLLIQFAYISHHFFPPLPGGLSKFAPRQAKGLEALDKFARSPLLVAGGGRASSTQKFA